MTKHIPDLENLPEAFIDSDGEEWAIAYQPVVRTVNVGDTVTWNHAWGRGPQFTGTVEDVDVKNGEPIFIVGDKWAYENQIVGES